MEERQVSSPGKTNRGTDEYTVCHQENVIWQISLHFSNHLSFSQSKQTELPLFLFKIHLRPWILHLSYHMSFYVSQSKQTVTAIFIQNSKFLTYTVLILQNKPF
jgi:hypothetical protein